MLIFKYILVFFMFLSTARAADHPQFTGVDSTKENSVHAPDSWFGVDKAAHFSASLMAAVSGGTALQNSIKISRPHSAYLGFGFSISLGLGKELVDSQKEQGRFSGKDFVADILGSLVGSFILMME